MTLRMFIAEKFEGDTEIKPAHDRVYEFRGEIIPVIDKTEVRLRKDQYVKISRGSVGYVFSEWASWMKESPKHVDEPEINFDGFIDTLQLDEKELKQVREILDDLYYWREFTLPEPEEEKLYNAILSIVNFVRHGINKGA